MATKQTQRLDGMSVRIPDDVHERLKAYCGRPPGLKIIGVVALAIAEYLDRQGPDKPKASPRRRK